MAGPWLNSRAVHAMLIIFLSLQVLFWYKTQEIKPDLTIVPEPPSSEVASAMAMGDEQFLFRYFSVVIQSAGDTWGRFTPLKLYDLSKMSKWFYLMDKLDARSNVIPSIAAYYFSQTQKTQDVRYMVDYLYDHSTADVKNKWWWLLQSIYLANHKLKDPDLALKVAKPLVNKDVPVFAQQMAAVVHEKRGEFDDALRIMETIHDNTDNIRDEDLKYMMYFIEERIHRLDEYKKSLKEKAKK